MANSFLRKPYQIIQEKLKGTDTSLTGFFMSEGANFYVFTYLKGKTKRHTFIDAGDARSRELIVGILRQNHIDLVDTERIIVTHSHSDHCGATDLLAQESGANILAHPEFRSFVEREPPPSERGWWEGTGFKPSNLQPYMRHLHEKGVREIGGVSFPVLGDLIEVGEGAKLEVLGCPASKHTHSPDQLIVFYSPRLCPETMRKIGADFRPTDELLFSGDLWLMDGPRYGWNTRSIMRYLRHRFDRKRGEIKARVTGKPLQKWVPAREQDAEAKDALKIGFPLVRVFAGHPGDPEHHGVFLGSRIVPNSLWARQDLLARLGYHENGDKAILKREDMALAIGSLEEEAYSSFVGELRLWNELGYSLDDISHLLARIFREQSGGGRLVREDRKERRQKLREILARLRADGAQSAHWREMAASTLSKL